MHDAPFHSDLANGPDTVRALWRHAGDGVRLRLACWPAQNAVGSVLLFPGRSEYVEKYGPVATDLTAAGLSVLAIDWRGQGFSDRLADEPRLGHVGAFSDYQLDVAELILVAHDLKLPRPWHLLAHSMGGCIGYRALSDGLDVTRAVFSAPMWGIQMPFYFRPLAHALPPLARMVGAEERFAPRTRAANYITETDFPENTLTTDRATYQWLRNHATAHPEFALGGPSVHWVGEATLETIALANLARPALPVRTYLGSDEAIVSAEAIQRLHANWPSAEFFMIEGAKHELMMEAAPIRDRFLNETIAFFSPE